MIINSHILSCRSAFKALYIFVHYTRSLSTVLWFHPCDVYSVSTVRLLVVLRLSFVFSSLVFMSIQLIITCWYPPLKYMTNLYPTPLYCVITWFFCSRSFAEFLIWHSIWPYNFFNIFLRYLFWKVFNFVLFYSVVCQVLHPHCRNVMIKLLNNLTFVLNDGTDALHICRSLLNLPLAFLNCFSCHCHNHSCCNYFA